MLFAMLVVHVCFIERGCMAILRAGKLAFVPHVQVKTPAREMYPQDDCGDRQLVNDALLMPNLTVHAKLVNVASQGFECLVSYSC